MTTQEQFQLVFKRIRDEDGDVSFYVEHTSNINQNLFIAHLLYMMKPSECDGIIEAIEKAENNQPFDPYHGPDSLSDDDEIVIVPPNVTIASGEWNISMEDWKQLMQEWADFQRS